MANLSDGNITTLAQKITALRAEIEDQQVGHHLAEARHPIHKAVASVASRVLHPTAPSGERAYYTRENRFRNLEALLRQLDSEMFFRESRRSDRKHTREHEERLATIEREGALYEKRNTLRDKIGADVLMFTIIGNGYEEPTEDRWGVMMVDVNDTEENIMAFISAHRARAEQIHKGIDQRFAEYSRQSREGDGKSGFHISFSRRRDFSAYDLERNPDGLPTPNYLLRRADQVAQNLRQLNGITEKIYPGLVRETNFGDEPAKSETTIYIGTENNVHFYDSGYMLGVNVLESADQNADFVRGVLAQGDPVSIDAWMKEQGRGEYGASLNQDMLEYTINKALDDEGVFQIGILLVRRGTEYAEPSSENGGVMTINASDSAQNIADFVRVNASQADRMWHEKMRARDRYVDASVN